MGAFLLWLTVVGVAQVPIDGASGLQGFVRVLQLQMAAGILIDERHSATAGEVQQLGGRDECVAASGRHESEQLE